MAFFSKSAQHISALVNVINENRASSSQPEQPDLLDSTYKRDDHIYYFYWFCMITTGVFGVYMLYVIAKELYENTCGGEQPLLGDAPSAFVGSSNGDDGDLEAQNDAATPKTQNGATTPSMPGYELISDPITPSERLFCCL